MQDTKSVKFLSLLNPNRAYEVSDDWAWDGRGAAPLDLHLKAYDTYGDGLTQHSGYFVPQWADVTDVCASIAHAILADPKNEAWSLLHLPEPRFGLLAFVRTIVYDPDENAKTKYFNPVDLKISTADRYRFDKRWQKVESWMNGSPAACLSLLLNDRPSDWLEKLLYADALRDAMGYPCWEDVFKPTAELKGDWHQAFEAYRCALQAAHLLRVAERQLENSLASTRRSSEAEQKAVVAIQ